MRASVFVKGHLGSRHPTHAEVARKEIRVHTRAVRRARKEAGNQHKKGNAQSHEILSRSIETRTFAE